MPDLNTLFKSKKSIKSVSGRVRTKAQFFGSFRTPAWMPRSAMHRRVMHRRVMHWGVMHWSLRDRSARDCAVMHWNTMH